MLAGNVHMTELVPQFADTLLPIFSTTVITAPLGDELHDAIRYPGAVGDGDPAGHHHRVVDGGRLMWSGQSTVWLGKPQRHADALIRKIRRTYPALRGLKAEHAWIGVTGHTVHGMPQIGEVAPGLWLLNGFGGHGLNTTAMAGEMVAHAIVEGDRTWEMFSPFALVWAGGAFGRAAQQVSDWARRARRTGMEFSRAVAEANAGAPKPRSPGSSRAAAAIPDVPPPIEPVAAAAHGSPSTGRCRRAAAVVVANRLPKYRRGNRGLQRRRSLTRRQYRPSSKGRSVARKRRRRPRSEAVQQLVEREKRPPIPRAW